MTTLHYIPADSDVNDFICVKCLLNLKEHGGAYTRDLSHWLTPPEDYERCLYDARVSRPVRHGV